MPTTWTAHTIHFLIQPELRSLFRVMTRKRDRALFLLAYRHEFRASEVDLLHVDDLNLAQQRITIYRVKRSLSGVYPVWLKISAVSPSLRLLRLGVYWTEPSRHASNLRNGHVPP